MGGKPNKTLVIAKEIHAAFQAMIPPPKGISYPAFNSIIQIQYGIGSQQAYNVTKDGESIGLWKWRRGNAAVKGYVEFLGLQATNPPEPLEQLEALQP